MRKHLSYANVTATLALAIAVGGGVALAAVLPRNSVKSKHIAPGAVKAKDVANNAISGPKVRPDSLDGSDIREGTLEGVDAGLLGGLDPLAYPLTGAKVAQMMNNSVVPVPLPIVGGEPDPNPAPARIGVLQVGCGEAIGAGLQIFEPDPAIAGYMMSSVYDEDTIPGATTTCRSATIPMRRSSSSTRWKTCSGPRST